GSDTYVKLKNNIKDCSWIIYISDHAKNVHYKIDFSQYNKLVKIRNPITIPGIIDKPRNNSSRKRIFFNGLTESIKIKKLDILLKAIQSDDALKDKVEVFAICNDEGKQYI